MNYLLRALVTTGAFFCLCLVLEKVDYKVSKNATGKDFLKIGTPEAGVQRVV